jgi:L-rhamnose isomerase/sugar isomerase
MLTQRQEDKLRQALDSFFIEIPSWGFANTGTRFGKFVQAAAATTIEEKLSCTFFGIFRRAAGAFRK